MRKLVYWGMVLVFLGTALYACNWAMQKEVTAEAQQAQKKQLSEEYNQVAKKNIYFRDPDAVDMCFAVVHLPHQNVQVTAVECGRVRHQLVN